LAKAGYIFSMKTKGKKKTTEAQSAQSEDRENSDIPKRAE
jgi:hypothetical protein